MLTSRHHICIRFNFTFHFIFYGVEHFRGRCVGARDREEERWCESHPRNLEIFDYEEVDTSHRYHYFIAVTRCGEVLLFGAQLAATRAHAYQSALLTFTINLIPSQ